MNEKNLVEVAKDLRKKVLRMICNGKSCHVGTCLSEIDLLAALYFKVMKHDPQKPDWDDRDRFILSKGHGCAGLYATLAKSGYFPEAELDKYLSEGTPYTAHTNQFGIPGIEFATGSLGHGLSVALGMAYTAKLEKKDHRVFTLLSDGEMDEGSNWEAILAAGNFKLDNLVAIIDYNKIQSFGRVDEIMPLEPLGKKFKSFNWAVKEIDGHNLKEIVSTLLSTPFEKDKPSVIVAHTVKGKGVSVMEDKLEWHYLTPTEEHLQQAEKELE